MGNGSLKAAESSGFVGLPVGKVPEIWPLRQGLGRKCGGMERQVEAILHAGLQLDCHPGAGRGLS